jgi:hypothetical protein
MNEEWIKFVIVDEKTVLMDENMIDECMNSQYMLYPV